LRGKHGEIALDGDGGNSTFVTALVRHIATPGIEINTLFRLVRDDIWRRPAASGNLSSTDCCRDRIFISPRR